VRFEAVAKAWQAGDLAAAVKAAKAAGLGVTAAQLGVLEAAIAKTNGTRKVRLLDVAQVIEAIAAALDDAHGVGVVHGGEANVGEQRTSLCLAYRDGTSLTVGVGLSAARNAGPGVTWKQLQPWSKLAPEKNVTRLRAWGNKRANDRVAFAITKRPAAINEPDALLAAVLADPDDDGARAVYADRLIERGDPRGDFITTQLALAKAPRQAKLATAARALLKAHAATWSRGVAQFTLKQHYHRGFIERVEMRGAAFASHGEKLFAAAPIHTIRLRDLDLAALRSVAATQVLAKVRALELDTFNTADLTLLARGKLDSLRSLDLDLCDVDNTEIARGLAAIIPVAPKLERVVVTQLVEVIAAILLPCRAITVETYRAPRRTTSVAALERARRIVRLARDELR
jgi:uncharacterized protein (TIGR02996 family)